MMVDGWWMDGVVFGVFAYGFRRIRDEWVWLAGEDQGCQETWPDAGLRRLLSGHG